MKFILARTHHNKRGKRHIVTKSSDLNYLMTLVDLIKSPEYDYEIYSGNWKLLYRANDEAKMHLIKDGE